MPAKSKAQKRFMGMVLEAKRTGHAASKEVREAAKSMTAESAKDYAKGSGEDLPEKVSAYLDGFTKQCQARGVDPETLLTALEKQAGPKDWLGRAAGYMASKAVPYVMRGGAYLANKGRNIWGTTKATGAVLGGQNKGQALDRMNKLKEIATQNPGNRVAAGRLAKAQQDYHRAAVGQTLGRASLLVPAGLTAVYNRKNELKAIQDFNEGRAAQIRANPELMALLQAEAGQAQPAPQPSLAAKPVVETPPPKDTADWLAGMLP